MLEQLMVTAGVGAGAAGVRVLVHWLAVRERERVFSRALRSRGSEVTVEYRDARLTVRTGRGGDGDERRAER
ncbi:hypothetical protein GCM10023347_36790 [Streptomyces chumphonensis]|uniref:Uncharacterized protein n=1 Tax=Streptomyces chumphonensis TaxID=1214925 RepID=A0A927EWN7_9ACTN|nr:hypothetical protein [Streptomyces chumphonensis]MBD3930785.1 hypothetical protein [Streptomyces chumphonensis]